MSVARIIILYLTTNVVVTDPDYIARFLLYDDEVWQQSGIKKKPNENTPIETYKEQTSNALAIDIDNYVVAFSIQVR